MKGLTGLALYEGKGGERESIKQSVNVVLKGATPTLSLSSPRCAQRCRQELASKERITLLLFLSFFCCTISPRHHASQQQS